MNKKTFHALSGKWMIRILLEMPDKGTRFTPLEHELVISPSRLNDNLIKLESMELIKHLSPIERRHPLLPEYIFTEYGLDIKNELEKIQVYQCKMPFDIYEKWTLLVLIELIKHSKFNQIKKVLNITPKVLSQRLVKLMALDIIDKKVIQKNPMEIEYVIESHWTSICHDLNNIIEDVR